MFYLYVFKYLTRVFCVSVQLSESIVLGMVLARSLRAIQFTKQIYTIIYNFPIPIICIFIRSSNHFTYWQVKYLPYSFIPRVSTLLIVTVILANGLAGCDCGEIARSEISGKIARDQQQSHSAGFLPCNYRVTPEKLASMEVSGTRI